MADIESADAGPTARDALSSPAAAGSAVAGPADPGAKAPIAIYLPSLGGGGAERAMVTLANGLVDRGWPVDLVLVQAHGPYLADVDPRVAIRNLGKRRVLASIPALARYIRRSRPAAIITAMSHANLAAIIARALSLCHPPLIVSERSSIAAQRRHFRGLFHRSMRLGMRLLYRRADLIVAVSEAMAGELREMLRLPPARIMTIYNPVVSADIERMAREPASHDWLDDGGAPVILAVGRLSIEKDFPTLIRAFALLRARTPARLLILGEGPERGRLEALAERLGVAADVALPGFAANPFAAMARARLFVLSSYYEGLPNALIQAMACGAPVIATDCPTGPAEILEGGRWGRLVPVGDADALCAAMDASLADASHPDGRLRAADFSVDRAVSAFGAFIDDLVAGARRVRRMSSRVKQ